MTETQLAGTLGIQEKFVGEETTTEYTEDKKSKEVQELKETLWNDPNFNNAWETH